VSQNMAAVSQCTAAVSQFTMPVSQHSTVVAQSHDAMSQNRGAGVSTALPVSQEALCGAKEPFDVPRQPVVGCCQGASTGTDLGLPTRRIAAKHCAGTERTGDATP
jgi:hypothetical protein